MQKENKIESIMNSAIEKLKDMVETNTVLGEKIETPTGFVVPLTKISVGFVAGGGEYSAGQKQVKTTSSYPYAGGTGSGVCVQPIGFLCVENGKTSLIKLDSKNPLEKIVDNLPRVAEAVAGAIKGNKCEKN